MARAPVVPLVALLILLGLPVGVHAQIFLASRPNPKIMIGPLFVRASMTPSLGDTVVDVSFSIVVPPGVAATGAGQDLYLLWPSAVVPDEAVGRADPALGKEIAQQPGLAVIEEGRVAVAAVNLYRRGPDGRGVREAVKGGAAFVTYVREGGGMGGLSSPATYIRIPWTPRITDRDWLVSVKLTTRGLIKVKPSTWLERSLWGERHRLTLSFGDVRPRAIFPVYFRNRDRIIKLSDDPSQLLVNFSHADMLKIDEMFPPSARRQLSESLDNTEVVSAFLDPSEGLRPQTLTVQFGYFSGLQSWAPILIPAAIFALGNLAGPIFLSLARRVGRTFSARVHIGRGDEAARDAGVVIPRETLTRIVPGETRYEDLIRLVGARPEEIEQLTTPDRKTLVYRGRRVVPHRRRSLGWLATVDHWDVENHEVEIAMDRDVVADIQARVRRSRLQHPES
jgi:hypothetical protein